MRVGLGQRERGAPVQHDCDDHRRADDRGGRDDIMSTGAAIALGAVTGLVLGILVSVATDVPLAPEVGLAVGVLVGWRLGRNSG
jgi:hypothetical protein